MTPDRIAEATRSLNAFYVAVLAAEYSRDCSDLYEEVAGIDDDSDADILTAWGY